MVRNYSLFSKALHFARLFLISLCYMLCYSYVISMVLFKDYISKVDFYKLHNFHKLFGLVLLALFAVEVFNRVKNGFASQESDKLFEKIAKKLFFTAMYVVLFIIMVSGLLANYEQNLIFVNMPIFLKGLPLKIVIYKLHVFFVKMVLPLMISMHIFMALLRFFDKKRHHAKMFRKNTEAKNFTLH